MRVRLATAIMASAIALTACGDGNLPPGAQYDIYQVPDNKIHCPAADVVINNRGDGVVSLNEPIFSKTSNASVSWNDADVKRVEVACGDPVRVEINGGSAEISLWLSIDHALILFEDGVEVYRKKSPLSGLKKQNAGPD